MYSINFIPYRFYRVGYNKGMKIIPWKKRNVMHVMLAVIVALLSLLIAGVLWLAIITGTRDVMTIILAVMFTIASGCALMCLVTGRLEWLLIGLWELPY